MMFCPFKVVNLTLLMVILNSGLLMFGVPAQEPALKNVQEWTRQLKEQLFGEKISMDNQIENLLKQCYRHHINDFKKLGGIDIVTKMADSLSIAFQQKVDALRRLKSHAEHVVLQHQYDANSGLKNVTYFYMQPKNRESSNAMTLKYNSNFNRNVNNETSGVHIPVEIYKGDRSIQNGLLWTSKLDDVFKENAKRDPKLKWQFFGSQDGFLRVFPANSWLYPSSSHNDLYDVRRRPWYIQSIASPKDILILMDVSGSVQGQTLEILKSSVKSLLETLEENDYVHIAYFNNTAAPVSCFGSFVQANSQNKKKLSSDLEHLRAGSVTNYASAFEYAFRLFKNFTTTKESYEGSECNRAIMFFTDGGTDRADAVLAEHNPNAEIRIFTFAVGPHATPTHVLREMACKGRGYFHTVSARGAVSAAAQHYPGILARPMALEDGSDATYSAAYTDAGGLGLVVSVTLPVYNRTVDEGNQTTVGILGIDIPTKELSDMMPFNQTGPNAYAFIINRNGYVVLHPKMIVHYLEDAPDVDMLDVELDDKPQEPYLTLVRDEMINGNTGSKQYHTFVNAGDSNHICQKNVTYYYAPIKNTPFSLGIVIPDDHVGYINPLYTDVKQSHTIYAEVSKANEYRSLIAGVEFSPLLHNIVDFENWLKNISQDSYNESLLNRLLLDMECIVSLQDFFKTRFNLHAHRTAVFIGMEGGLTTISPPDQAVHFKGVPDPLRATYFRKAMHYSDWAFFVSDEISTSVLAITAVKAVTVDSYKPAVYGVQFKEASLNEIMRNFSGCNNPELLLCYLVDDGGYVIASNHINHKALAGRFLGEEDATLMSTLMNHSLYKRHLEHDYHATCTEIQDSISGTASSGPISLLEFIGHFVLDFVAWLTMWPFTHSSASEIPFSAPTAHRKYINKTCTKRRALYYFSPAHNEISGSHSIQGEVICGNCTRKLLVANVPDSNLIFVVVRPKDHCSSDSCALHNLQHVEEEIESPDVCAVKPRYRRRPSTCYANHTFEDTSQCSTAVQGWEIPVPVIFGSFWLNMWLLWGCVVCDSHYIVI